jgi:hypothetical protein
MAKKPSVAKESQQSLSDAAMKNELYAISRYLQKLKFSHRVMGVDEADVWRKLEKICELYEDVLTAERMKSAQLEQDYNDLRATFTQIQQKYNALKDKSKQLLAAYQKLAGEGREDG